jgi:hypothetical protein
MRKDPGALPGATQWTPLASEADIAHAVADGKDLDEVRIRKARKGIEARWMGKIPTQTHGCYPGKGPLR